MGRASSEPHSYVLTWLSVTIYIFIYIDRPTAVFDPAPGVKVGCCWQNVRVVTLCENDLLYWCMFLHIGLRIRRWSTLSEFSCCVRLSALNHSAKNIRTSEKCHQVKEAGTFFCLRAAGIETCSFVFRLMLIEKAYSTKQRYYCKSLSSLPHLIDNSATKRSFFDRQLSYSCRSHSRSVLAANDCRVFLIFLQHSPSFILASQAGSNTITSPGMPANVRTSQTPTTWTRTRVELVRGLMCLHKKTRTNTVTRRWFFRSLFIKSRAGESSQSLRQSQQSPRLAPQCLAFP